MLKRYENDQVAPSAIKARQSIASELKAARRGMGLTQQNLAERAGTKKSNISRMESGKYNPSLDFLVKVADSLGKSIDIHLN